MQKGAGNVFGGIFEHYPEVSISSPLDDAVFAANSDITLVADATIEDGAIKKVDFFSDSLVGTDTIAPYTIVWENVPEGTHQLYAIATDSLGARKK